MKKVHKKDLYFRIKRGDIIVLTSQPDEKLMLTVEVLEHSSVRGILHNKNISIYTEETYDALKDYARYNRNRYYFGNQYVTVIKLLASSDPSHFTLGLSLSYSLTYLKRAWNVYLDY